jgi:hypothetical protein
MTVANKIKTRDWQTANVILDFKEQQVLAASVKGMVATRDWDTIVSYYYKHYAATIERMFVENGHRIDVGVKKINDGS